MKKKPNNLTNVKKCSVCCVKNTPRLPIAQARFFLVRRPLDFKTYKYMASLRDTGNVLRQTRQKKRQRIQMPEYYRNVNEQLQGVSVKRGAGAGAGVGVGVRVGVGVSFFKYFFLFFFNLI